MTANTRSGIVFHSGRRWVAIVAKVPARVQPSRRAWLVTKVKRY